MNERREALLDALLEGLIVREYQVLNPQLTVDFKERAIDSYRMDGVFHARVQALTYGIMALVDKYAEFPE